MKGRTRREQLALCHDEDVTILTYDEVRVFANAGVGSLVAGRWNDVKQDHPQLADWIEAGLVSLTGPKGEPAPTVLKQTCCGGR